jgi:methyl-accepting chemotaxis protein
MNFFKSLSIKAKVAIASALIIFLSFIAMSISNYFTSQKGLVERITNRELPVYIDNIYNSIQTYLWKRIMVSEVNSKNLFLINWFKQETENEEKMTDFLRLVNKEYGFLVGVASASSLNYYSTNGVDRVLSNDSDPWYFNFANSSELSSFNIGIDYTGTQEVKLWVNRKIVDQQGTFLGVFSIRIDISDVVKLVLSKQYGENGNIMMVDKDGAIKVHKDQSLIDISNKGEKGKTIHSIDGISSVANNLLMDSEKAYAYQSVEGEYIVIARYIPELNWYLIVEVSKTELTKEPRNLFYYSLLFGIVIMLVIIYLSVLLVNNAFIKPTRRIIEFIKEISEGKLNASIEMERTDELGAILTALRQMQKTTAGIANEILESSGSIINVSQQISDSSHRLSQGASEQAANVEEVSASMEEMVANIHQNTENAKETETISSSAAHSVEVMNESSERSLNMVSLIADKITIINDIAFQTNLLALNAAVEAARAGEAGKGFAVVASEVRKLAERSKTAADEINQLSNQSLEVTSKAKELIVKTFPEIQKTSNLVQNIAAASVEQISGAEQVNSAIQQVNSVAQVNAATAEQLSASSELFKDQAMRLKESISFFKF